MPPSINRRMMLLGLTSTGAALAAESFAAISSSGITANVRDFGVTADGLADDSAAFAEAVASGAKTIVIPAGKYRISRQIVVPSGVTLRGVNLPTLILDVRGFNETDIGQCYAANACALMFLGNTGGGVFGLRFTPSAYGAELVAMAIALRQCEHVEISGCDFGGFSKAKIVRIDSSRSCTVTKNHFHDCRLASTGPAQLTCIDVDDNRIAGGSKNLRITANIIRRIMVSPAFLAAHGDQSDGINISHSSSSDHLIADNDVEIVGEGIDCFGQGCTIRNNRLSMCTNYGIKLVHGACNNVVKDNIIEKGGLGGIVLAGSRDDASYTEGNVVSGNRISDVGVIGPWAGSTTFGIKLEDDHGAKTARGNIIRNNIIARGARMDVGIMLADNSIDNLVESNDVQNYAKRKYLFNNLKNNTPPH